MTSQNPEFANNPLDTMVLYNLDGNAEQLPPPPIPVRVGGFSHSMLLYTSPILPVARHRLIITSLNPETAYLLDRFVVTGSNLTTSGIVTTMVLVTTTGSSPSVSTSKPLAQLNTHISRGAMAIIFVGIIILAGILALILW